MSKVATVMVSVMAFAEIRPVLEIPGAPIDLVNDHAPDLAAAEKPQHLVEGAPSALGGGHRLLEPVSDLKAISFGVLPDRVALLLEGDALFALSRRGNTDVTVECVH